MSSGYSSFRQEPKPPLRRRRIRTIADGQAVVAVSFFLREAALQEQCAIDNMDTVTFQLYRLGVRRHPQGVQKLVHLPGDFGFQPRADLVVDFLFQDALVRHQPIHCVEPAPDAAHGMLPKERPAELWLRDLVVLRQPVRKPGLQFFIFIHSRIPPICKNRASAAPSCCGYEQI